LCAQEQGNGLTNLDEIDVLLISDRKISELHRRFMQISGPTDVITFQHGEIFISVETAQRQAKAFQTTMDDEIRLYLVHGLLHLQGFDDNQPKARRRIEAAQTRILRRLLPHLGR
jgi:probable rRNA maturation factor